MDTKLLKQKYQLLTPVAKRVMFSKKTVDDLWAICQSYNLEDDKIGLVAYEVIVVILGINSKEKLADQIEKGGIERGVAGSLANEIDGKILRKTEEKFGEEVQNKNEQNQNNALKTESPKETVKSYDSFEQSVLRQAQAMKPALASPKPISTAPNNLPGAMQTSPVIDLSPKIEKRDIPKQYTSNTDPYREPIE